MGLDMYAYTCKPDQIEGTIDFELPEGCTVLAYWRKHPNLHGWMERKYIEHGGDVSAFPSFNGDTLRLGLEDVQELERATLADVLPHTEGFFFGVSGWDGTHKETTLRFCEQAQHAILEGMAVVYTSSW